MADRGAPPAQAQDAGSTVFGRAFEEQLELCRFFAKRWEQYAALPASLTRCRSATDLAQLQVAFLSKMAADYNTEGCHVAEILEQLVSAWMSAHPALFIGKQQE